MKINKLKTITDEQLSAYKNNPNIRRRKVLKSGYQYIVYATDQDLDWPFGVSIIKEKDGIHIRSLLSGFIHKYLPEYEGRVGILDTPVVAFFKNDKIQHWIYNLNEEIEIKKGEKSFYFKGLGSWDKNDLQEVIKVDGIEKMISIINFENGEENLNDWLGSDSTPRKKFILENTFSIADA